MCKCMCMYVFLWNTVLFRLLPIFPSISMRRVDVISLYKICNKLLLGHKVRFVSCSLGAHMFVESDPNTGIHLITLSLRFLRTLQLCLLATAVVSTFLFLSVCCWYLDRKSNEAILNGNTMLIGKPYSRISPSHLRCKQGMEWNLIESYKINTFIGIL